MKLFFIVHFVFFCIISIHSQSVLKGKVVIDESNLTLVKINNITSNYSTQCNKEGFFSIAADVDDILQISSSNAKNLKIVVNTNLLTQKTNIFTLQSKTHQLDEVIITNHKLFDAYSLGIISTPAKKYTPAERRLKTAGDFKPIHLLGLIGGQFQLDPVLNAINGKTKRLKKEVKVERNEKMLQKLDAFFNQEFYTDTLQIPFEYKDGFQIFVLDDNRVVKSINENNKTFTGFLLTEMATKYKSIIFPKQ